MIQFLSAVVLGASAASAAGRCPTEPQTVAGVLATERAWVTALDQRDARALGCILAPEFADTSWRGELLPKADVVAALPSRPASTLKLTELRPALIGNVAIVRGVNTQSSGGKVVGSVRFVDVFVYRSARWQAISAQESLIQPK
jgi:hypothetical protein